MSSVLRIAVSEEKGNVPVTVFHLKGDLDASTHTELEHKANEAIDGGVANLLLDLSGVTYMGSAGLRAFQTISNKLKDSASGQLKLVNPSEPVSKVMKTLGFDQYFDIYNDVDAAVQAF